MTYDLFISHSSEDAETALALVADFENRNITCWVAPRDIPMGSSYHEEIVQAIENSRAVLLLFSSNANKSASNATIRRERTFGIDNQTPSLMFCEKALEERWEA